MTTLSPPRNFGPARQSGKLTPILTIVLVFLCGAVAGAVVMSYFGHTHPTAIVQTPRLTMSVVEWKSKLELTDEQTLQLTSILDDFSRMYDNFLADGNARIVQILNDKQKQKFDQMMRDLKKR